MTIKGKGANKHGGGGLMPILHWQELKFDPK